MMQECGQRLCSVPVTASRMRACACDTASRLCVRTVVCWSAFSLVPPLGSTCSSAARAASFAGFTATMGESDFSGPFIVGFGLRPSRRGPCKTPQGQSRDIPVPEQGASAHARVYDDAEPTYVSRPRHGPYCLLQDGKHLRSEVGFRRSMAGLRYPLSTLRFAPHGSPRMTRGRCGSLRLHRRGLSPHTSCRSPGAPVHPNRRARQCGSSEVARTPGVHQANQMAGPKLGAFAK